MIAIDLNAILAILSILGIAGGAIIFMVRLWNRVDNSLLKHAIALDTLVQKVSTLEGYDKRITKNETDIKLIKQQCHFYHQEEE